MGKWYLISRITQWYDFTCENETAEYTLIDNNTFEVLNTCYINGKGANEIIGEAKVLDIEKNEFFVSFSSDQPVMANYIILKTDYTSYSLVGSFNNEGLWILSRTKQMEVEKLEELIYYAERMGYNIDMLNDTKKSIIY